MRLTNFLRGWGLRLGLGLSLGTLAAGAQDPSPFALVPTLVTNAGRPTLQLEFRLPADHLLYADKLEFQLAGSTNRLSVSRPVAQSVKDRFSGLSKPVFARTFTAEWILPRSRPEPLSLLVQFQGCSATSCFFPEVRQFDFGRLGGVSERPLNQVECHALPAPPTPGSGTPSGPGRRPGASSASRSPRPGGLR